MKIENFVCNFLQKQARPSLLYHNQEHSLWVAKQARQAGRKLALPPEKQAALLLAAYFHDLGYCQSAKNHEALSCDILDAYAEREKASLEELFQALDLLQPAGSLGEIYGLAKECIAATKIGAKPSCTEAALLADIDLAYSIGSPAYERRSDALRREWELDQDRYFCDADWLDLQRQFLKNAQWNSGYARYYFVSWQRKNLSSLL